MNQHSLEQLKRDMEEVVALPDEHPMRAEVIERITQAGPEAEAYWLNLTQEDEQLRLMLKHVNTPHGLHDRLRSIPETADAITETQTVIYKYNRWISGVAAILLIGVMIFIFAQPETLQATETVAMMAITHHTNQADELKVTSSDPRVVERTLSAGLHFNVTMPKMDPAYKLLGGGKCKFGSHDVVYTRWEKEGKTFTLYQFCKHYFGIPRELQQQTVKPKVSSKYKVLFWSKDDICAYALVEESP